MSRTTRLHNVLKQREALSKEIKQNERKLYITSSDVVTLALIIV